MNEKSLKTVQSCCEDYLYNKHGTKKKGWAGDMYISIMNDCLNGTGPHGKRSGCGPISKMCPN